MPKEGICDIIKGMKCERCKNEKAQTKAGSQKYKYKICGEYIPKPKESNYIEEAKKQAIKLYMVGISKNMCLYWSENMQRKLKLKLHQKNE